MKRIMAFMLSAMIALPFLGGCSMIEDSSKKEAMTTAEQEEPDEKKADSSNTENLIEENDETQTDAHEYIIYYYEDIDADEPSDQSTTAIYGTGIRIMTIDELGFSNAEEFFEGWRLYREMDDKWYVRSPKGKIGWRELENGQLPEGYVFQLRKNGGVLTQPAPEGNVRLYAQWGGEEFTVVYHEDNDSKALDMTTTITYGELTPLYYVSDLGIEKDGKEFAGWVLYREIDDKWYVKNEDGKGSWIELEDGELPKGYSYYICSDGAKLTKAATSGIVHAYAQWK